LAGVEVLSLQLKRTSIDLSSKIAAIININSKKEFKLGTFDCCIWGATAIDAICDTKFIKRIYGKYDDVRSAIQFLKDEFDANNVLDAFGSICSEQHVAYARIGDLVYQKSNYMGFNAVIGVCYGRHSFFVNYNEEEQGLVSFPTLQCDGSFKVG
jgi:hypothetical protein